MKELNGHGRIICEKCKKIIVTCRCIKCGENIMYDICEECKNGEIK